MAAATPDHDLLCPSAQPDQSGAMAIGVIGGTAAKPRVTYLRSPLPVIQSLLDLASPVEPTEVFRFAAPCAQSACQHFADNECSLVTKITRLVDGTDYGVPPCGIRPRCRWWKQEGVAACRRCPLIVTRAFGAAADIREAADPLVAADPWSTRGRKAHWSNLEFGGHHAADHSVPLRFPRRQARLPQQVELPRWREDTASEPPRGN